MTIEYYMDYCSLWEIDDIIECLPYMDKNMLEASRLNTYVTALVFSKKSLKPQDFMKFAWENEDGKNGDIEITKKDVKRLGAKAKKILEMMRNGKVKILDI